MLPSSTTSCVMSRDSSLDSDDEELERALGALWDAVGVVPTLRDELQAAFVASERALRLHIEARDAIARTARRDGQPLPDWADAIGPTNAHRTAGIDPWRALEAESADARRALNLIDKYRSCARVGSLLAEVQRRVRDAAASSNVPLEAALANANESEVVGYYKRRKGKTKRPGEDDENENGDARDACVCCGRARDARRERAGTTEADDRGCEPGGGDDEVPAVVEGGDGAWIHAACVDEFLDERCALCTRRLRDSGEGDAGDEATAEATFAEATAAAGLAKSGKSTAFGSGLEPATETRSQGDASASLDGVVLDSKDAGTRAHRVCAAWASGLTRRAPAGRLARTPGLREEVRRAARLRCRACGAARASLGCWHARCQWSFHRPCAREFQTEGKRGEGRARGAFVEARSERRLHRYWCPRHRHRAAPDEESSEEDEPPPEEDEPSREGGASMFPPRDVASRATPAALRFLDEAPNFVPPRDDVNRAARAPGPSTRATGDDRTRANARGREVLDDDVSEDEDEDEERVETSAYRGVHWNRRWRRWISSITVDGKTKYIGSFTSEEAAARAWNDRARELGREDLNDVSEDEDEDEEEVEEDEMQERVYSSAYLGVYWDRSKGRWRSSIKVDGKTKYLGSFTSEEAAARAWNDRARELGREDINDVSDGEDEEEEEDEQEEEEDVEERGHTSAYRGVRWNKKSRRWTSCITVDGKTKHLGTFTSEKAAARAWNDRARELGREDINDVSEDEDEEEEEGEDDEDVEERGYKSAYRGVHWDKSTRRWRASVWVDGKTKHLGTFTSEKAAARAWNDRARELGREGLNDVSEDEDEEEPSRRAAPAGLDISGDGGVSPLDRGNTRELPDPKRRRVDDAAAE